MSHYNVTGINTFTSQGALPQYVRVLELGGVLQLAGLDDADIGVTNRPAFEAGEDVPVILRNVPGTQVMTASEPIARGMDVYAAASGQVGLDNSKDKCGVALTEATAAGDYISVMRVSGGGGGGGGLTPAQIRQFTVVDGGLHATLAAATTAYAAIFPIPAGEKHVATTADGLLLVADPGANAWTSYGGGTTTGRIIGRAATMATLPAAAANNGNYAILTAQDGANAPGLRLSNGTDWSNLVMALAAAANVDATVANLAARVATLVPAGQQDFLVSVTSNGLRYRTVDGGTTWTIVSRRVEVADAAALAALTEMVENQRGELLSDDTLWEFTAANGWAQIR